MPDWWFSQEKAGGGAVQDLGYHLLDLYRFFAGEAEVVFSSLDRKLNLAMEDAAIIVLRSVASDAKGILNVGWYQKTIFPRFNFRTILHGDAGFITTDELVPRNMYIHAAKEGMKNLLRKLVRKKISPLSYTYYYESYYKELNHFLTCVKDDSDPAVSASDGLRTIELVNEVYRQSGSKRDAYGRSRKPS